MLLLLAASLLASAIESQTADLVVTNAKLWSDGRFLKGDCVAITSGRIEYVGVFRKRLVGTRTKTVDAGGRVVIPGLIDCHTHFAQGGTTLLRLPLRDIKNRREFVQRIGSAAAKLRVGEWLRGAGWSTESWPDPAQPRKEWIDGVTKGHPIALDRMDGHSVFANSLALKMAGITRNGPPDPAGGVIVRDPATHEPTGVLSDNAMGLVNRIVPADDQSTIDEGLRAAIKEANRHGVTTVCDIGDYSAPYLRAYNAGNRSMRFFFFLIAGDGPWDGTVAEIKGFHSIPTYVEPRGIKAFMDGSMGSRTAYMHEPFTNPGPNHPKNWRGVELPGAQDGNYAKGIALAAKNNLQVIVHAIGDQANHDILDLFEQNAPGLATRRFRVEHAQHLLPADIPRFGQLGVIPSMQPLHKADDGRYAEEVVGKERCRSSYAYRSLLSTGAKVVFGSDWPVVSDDPFQGIAAAVTGRTLKGDIWFPEQNISLAEALKSYTSRAAYSFFEEKELGQIKKGYLGDIVILDRSPFKNGVDLRKVKPYRVFVGGRDVTVKD